MIDTTRGYYWFLLGVVVVVLVVLHFMSESRTGRAWKASREDPLAAELMGIPVNRLKIMAFSFGAGIAGLAGSIFAAVQTGAFPQNFGTAVLILIYAVVILGGTGSLTGMVVGAIVIIASNQVLDSTSPPNNARVLFYAVLIAAVLLTLKTWPKRIAALGGTFVFGLGAARDRRRPLVERHQGPGDVRRLPELGDRPLGADPRRPAQARRLGLPAADRLHLRARPAEGLVADRGARPDALPGRVRLGEPDDPAAGRHPFGPLRRAADRADDHPPERAARRRKVEIV